LKRIIFLALPILALAAVAASTGTYAL